MLEGSMAPPRKGRDPSTNNISLFSSSRVTSTRDTSRPSCTSTRQTTALSTVSHGHSWRVLSLASLYKFSKRAQSDLFKQFRTSPGCELSSCAYDPEDDVFEITCVAEESKRNLAVLKNLIEGHIIQQLNLSEVSDHILDVAPLTAAFVHKDLFEHPEPFDDENENGQPEKNADGTTTKLCAPFICWKPNQDDTDINVVASKDTLASLEHLTGCKLILDQVAGAIQVYSNNLVSSEIELRVSDVLDRLDIIEKEQHQAATVEHIPYVRGSPEIYRVRVSRVHGLKDGSFARVLFPSDWVDDKIKPKTLALMSVLRVMTYDIGKQEFVEVVRTVTQPPLPKSNRNVWSGFEFRSIGNGPPKVVLPKPELVPPMELVIENDQAIDQWVSKIQPGPPEFVYPELNRQKSRAMEKSSLTLDDQYPLIDVSDPREDNTRSSSFKSSFTGLEFKSRNPTSLIDLDDPQTEETQRLAMSILANDMVRGGGGGGGGECKEEEEEDIEKRIRLPSGRLRKPAPRRNPGKKTPIPKSLENLKANYITSNELVKAITPPIAAKGMADRIVNKTHDLASPSQKPLKSSQEPSNIPKKPTAKLERSTPDKIVVNARLFKCVSSALERAKTFRGFIEMQVQIGRILLPNDGTRLDRSTEGVDWSTVKAGLLASEGFKSRPGNFTQAVTSSAEETNVLLDLVGMECQEPYSQEAWWELICSTTDKKEVRIYIDAQKSTEPLVQTSKAVLGAVYIHAAGRIHDARLMITGSTRTKETSTVPGAQELINSIYVLPRSKRGDDCTSRQSGSNEESYPSRGSSDSETCTISSLMGRDGELRVEAIHLRSTLRFEINKLAGKPKQYLELVRVHDLPVERPDATALDNTGVFRARAKRDEALIATHRLWYEVNVCEMHHAHHFQANETLELGQEADWDSVDMVSDTSLCALEQFTYELIDKMDCVGFGNKGIGFGVMERIADIQAKKDDERRSNVQFW